MCICEEWFSQARIDFYYYDICIFRILWKRNAKQGNVNVCLIWSNIVSFKKWLRHRQNIIEGCKPHPDVNLGPKLFEHSSSGSNLGLWSFFFWQKKLKGTCIYKNASHGVHHVLNIPWPTKCCMVYFCWSTAKQWECFQIYISNVYLGIANILGSCYLEMKL